MRYFARSKFFGSLVHKKNFGLTHSFPMHPFSIPWKQQKTVRFSDVFRGWIKGVFGRNGLI